MSKTTNPTKHIKVGGKSSDVEIPVHLKGSETEKKEAPLLKNSALFKTWNTQIKLKQSDKKKAGVGKGYKPMDSRQVTHNLRRRMGK